MTAQELINNYLEAFSKLLKAKSLITEFEEVLKQDFKEKHPEYYISNIFTTGSVVTATICNASNDKIVTAFAYLSFDGDWKW